MRSAETSAGRAALFEDESPTHPHVVPHMLSFTEIDEWLLAASNCSPSSAYAYKVASRGRRARGSRRPSFESMTAERASEPAGRPATRFLDAACGRADHELLLRSQGGSTWTRQRHF